MQTHWERGIPMSPKDAWRMIECLVEEAHGGILAADWPAVTWRLADAAGLLGLELRHRRARDEDLGGLDHATGRGYMLPVELADMGKPGAVCTRCSDDVAQERVELPGVRVRRWMCRGCFAELVDEVTR